MAWGALTWSERVWGWGNAEAGPTGQSVTASGGDETVTGDANVSPDGSEATGSAGTPSFIEGIGVDVSPDGSEITVYVYDSVLIWGLINETQTASWSTIDDSETASWSAITDTQSNTWTEI